MGRKLLCPQEYTGVAEMRATVCSRCPVGWDRKLKRCMVPTGAEHFPLVPEAEVPTCPIQDRCQHQVQRGAEPCPVRARGMLCESALIASGMSESEAMNHPLSFNADLMATPEEWAERVASGEVQIAPRPARRSR